MWVPKIHTSQISASKQQTRPIWVRSKLMWGLPWILGWPLSASLLRAWPQCSRFKISRSEIAFGCHQSGLLAKTCVSVLSAVWLNRYMLDCFFFPLSCQVLLPIVNSSQISLIFCWRQEQEICFEFWRDNGTSSFKIQVWFLYLFHKLSFVAISLPNRPQSSDTDKHRK